jgi:cytochrome c553
MSINRKHLGIVSISMAILMLAACNSDEKATPLPTVTPIPYFDQEDPTEAPLIATAAAATAPEIDSTAVARGEHNWERLECFTCHGENGEGTDDAPALAETTLTEDEFIDQLRTGGTLGNDHLFSTDRLSNSGSKYLYQFVLSLSGSADESGGE